MSDAKVKFVDKFGEPMPAATATHMLFRCPKTGYDCGKLIIAGRTNIPRDGQNQNGGRAQWDFDGNAQAPTFAPSVDCKGCWHGYIENGRCVTVNHTDEPEPLPRNT